jgi:hypothetical protein
MDFLTNKGFSVDGCKGFYIFSPPQSPLSKLENTGENGGDGPNVLWLFLHF